MVLQFQLIDKIDNFFHTYGDPRVAELPLMSSPFPTLIIIALYIYCVKILGPKLMEKRLPFELNRVLLAYNFVQIMLSLYLFYEGSMGGWLTGDYNYYCQPVDFSHNPQALRIMRACWLYYIAKLTELLDTLFFVMRKKFDQVSILHVYHHSVMPINSWLGTKMTPGGHGTFFGLVNSFVHIIMYGYYFLSAFGPDVQRHLWWKKYLTSLQLIQFGMVFLHSIQILFTDCDFPRLLTWLILFESVIFFLLFKNFYNKTYVSKKLD